MRFLTFTILILIGLQSYSQTGAEKVYAVTFADKGPEAFKSVLSPSCYLSEKAIARRLKHNISFDVSDLPVYEPYIRESLTKGVEVLSRSRWLNCIVIKADAEHAGMLAQKNFVASVRPIAYEDYDLKDLPVKSPVEIRESPDNNSSIQTKSANAYNYGAAAGQINMIKGEYLHNLNYCGQGMTIAVLDNGFSKVDVLPAFDSLRLNNQILGTKDFVTPGANVFDPYGGLHGTMVLSTMASNLPGVIVGTAPKASYWLIHTEDNNGESFIEEYYWVSGAEFADSVGADIINSSLGYTTFPNSPEYDHTYADMDGNTCVSTIGADMAAKKGLLVVNSAGNSGGSSWFYIGAPADGDSVFTIGAVDASGVVTYFSSRGPTYDGRIKPDVAAQGQGTAIYSWNASSPNGAVFYGSGTSFSAPIIAGMSACLWQSSPSKSNMTIIDYIRNTSNNAQHPDSLTGWGIPDFEKAHAMLTSGTPELSQANHLFVYPNPFVNALTVVSPVKLSGNVSVDIFTPQGKSVMKSYSILNRPSGELVINVPEHVLPGFYILRISNGDTIFSSACIKQ